MIDWILDQINKIWAAFTSWATGIYDTVRGWINSVYSWTANIVNQVYGYIGATISSIQSWALATFAKIGEIASTIINYITNTYQTIVNNITHVINNIVNYITETYQTIVNNISNTYQTIVNNITNVIGLTVEKVEEWFRGTGGATKAWVEGLFVKAKDVWNTIAGNLEEWWKPKCEAIGKAIDDSWAKWATLLNGLSLIWDDIWSFITSPISWLASKFSLEEIGDDLTAGIEEAGGTETESMLFEATVPPPEKMAEDFEAILKDENLIKLEPWYEMVTTTEAELAALVRKELPSREIK